MDNNKKQNQQQLEEENQYKLKEEEKLKEELTQKSKPLFISKAFVNQPFLVIGIYAFIFLVCLIVYLAADLGEMSDPHDRDYLIWDNERTQDFDMLVQAQEDFQKSISENKDIPVRSITNTRWTTYLVFKNTNEDNLFTAEGIKLMYSIEQSILNFKNYKSFCISALDSLDCADEALTSITKLFQDPNNVSDDEISMVIDQITEDENMFIMFKGLFGDEFNKNNKKTHLIRTQLKFAGPLDIDGKRYKDIYDNQQEQLEKFDDFSQEIYDLIEELEESDKIVKKPENIEIYPYSQDMYVLQMQNTTDKDVKWAMGSIIFVLIYLAIHLKSLFLSFMSMLSIILSFPITFVIFRLVFLIDYYSSLHVLIVFIVLGISADNVFVFTDAWNQTATYEQLNGDYNKRMAVTFRRASKAMLATSSTTGAAFLATGLSPIMPISSFGFFAGILIPINFILVITFYPAILMVYEKYTKNMCVRKKKQNSNINNNQKNQQQLECQQQQIQQNNQNVIIEEEEKKVNKQNEQVSSEADLVVKNEFQSNNKFQTNNNQELQEKNPKQILKTTSTLSLNEIKPLYKQSSNLQQNQQQQQKENIVIKCFNNQFNTMVYKGRYVIVLFFAIWTGIAIWRTSQLPSLSAPEQFLEDAHPCQESVNLMRNDFHKSGNSNTGISVYQYWGVKSIDKSDVGAWASDELGDVVWDTEFDLSPKKNQLYMYDLCNNMLTDDLVQDQQVECFILNFRDFVEQEKNLQFPVEQDQFQDLLIEFTKDTNFSGASFYNENYIGIINGNLKFVVVKFSAFGIPYSPYDELNPVYEQWDDYINKINKQAPKGVNNSKQTALVGWVFMITERAFSSSAVNGTLISLSFAFVVLILVTFNIIIALYSIITISGVVLSAIAIMEIVGWELGVAESVAIVILIGMSVDYVVHLATHYIECSYPDRYRKMQISLKDLGISIISGATTTMGSGVFLFGAQLVLLQKFAILILVTISFSLFYALVFFSALVHIMGPQGKTGSITCLFIGRNSSQKKNQKNNNKQQENQGKQELDIEVQNVNNQNGAIVGEK